MTKIQFTFYALLLLLIGIFSVIDLTLGNQAIIAAVFIALIGIPHGAIDHKLYGGGLSMKAFILNYLMLIALTILIWIFFPRFALIGFLLLSAYHFGQSQFTSFQINSKLRRIVLYMAWGCAILSGLIFYNLEELQLAVAEYRDLQSFASFLNYQGIKYLLIVFASITIISLFIAKINGELLMEELLIELLYFGLIHLAFFALPLLIGFTLYFILLHSIKVLKEEFVYLERKEESMQLPQFLKLLLPLTLLALFGGGLLIIFLELNLINISYPLLFLILLSAITSPHSLVMERFYRQFKAL